MGHLAYKEQIRDRLKGKHHLIPVFTSVFAIPERLKEYDENLFVVFNTKKQHFEVHSLANQGDTFGLTIPLNELDARTLYLVRKNNLRTRGKEIFREIDEHNERLEKANQNRRKDEIRDVAEKVHPAFKKLGWEGA
jgi:hypothetical protein